MQLYKVSYKLKYRDFPTQHRTALVVHNSVHTATKSAKKQLTDFWSMAEAVEITTVKEIYQVTPGLLVLPELAFEDYL